MPDLENQLFLREVLRVENKYGIKLQVELSSHRKVTLHCSWDNGMFIEHILS